jgi:16S rRNA (cytosine1402-N4)-methyltransferase
LQAPHISVLLNEVVDVFRDIKDGVVVDCTLGYGGHTGALLRANEHIQMICCDQDDTALEFSKKALTPFGGRVVLQKSRFSKIIPLLGDRDIKGVLADIGVSSLQLDQKERGFAFDSEVLDMRMSSDTKITAYDVVNEYSKEELLRVLKEYSDLPNYKQVCAKIIENRPIKSAKMLSALASKMIRSSKIHPATLLFQAIRIEVNDELGELRTLLQSIKEANPKGAKIAIISFHSLEDRIVKETFKQWASKCICAYDAMRCSCGKDNDLGEILTKKPITPTQQEIAQNPRSRSSKMRVFKFYE